MESLKRLVVEAGNKKGGALLNVIYRLMINSSDKSIRDLFEFILEKSSVPYLNSLKKWIFEGILDDHFEEFIVKENTEFKKEQVNNDLNNLYWLERFTFRQDMIPNFLLKYKDKVLRTGKYLNVIREMGRDIKYTQTQFDIQKANLELGIHPAQQDNKDEVAKDEPMQIDSSSNPKDKE